MKIEKHYFEVPLHTSKYFNSCWTKINSEEQSFRALTEDPGFCYSDAVAIITGLLITFESVIGIVLNVLVILAVLRSKDIRKEYLTPSMLSIAITDFIFSACVIPVSASRFFSRDVPFPSYCHVTAYIGHVLWLLSALNLLGISLLRCFAVFFPWKTSNISFNYVCRITPLINWILSILAVLPTFLEKNGRFGLECRSFLCKIIDVDVEGNPTDFSPMLMYFIVIITSGNIMLLLALVTFFRVSYHSKNMFNQLKDASMDLAMQMLEKEKKVGRRGRGKGG